eukprot:4372095-Lingulodinium_polyedra.AAC.1
MSVSVTVIVVVVMMVIAMAMSVSVMVPRVAPLPAEDRGPLHGVAAACRRGLRLSGLASGPA